MQLEGEWDFGHNWRNRGWVQKKGWRLDKSRIGDRGESHDDEEAVGKEPGFSEV